MSQTLLSSLPEESTLWVPSPSSSKNSIETISENLYSEFLLQPSMI